MNSTELRVVISKSNIENQIAALLYSMRLVSSKTNITNIDFKELFKPNADGMVELLLNLNTPSRGGRTKLNAAQL